MGARFSPSLANLYMGWRERVFIFGDIRMYRQYIDDLLFISSGTVGTLDRFLQYLNTTLNLKFTGILDDRSVCFLDVVLSHREDHII